MARNLPPNDHVVEEDYIDMDFSSATFFCSSPPHPEEFQFQMSANPVENQPMSSPADELFYKGKLLPLQLPPRLQMVEELIQDPNSFILEHGSEHTEKSIFVRTSNTATTTPYMSCHASPAASCYVSGELNAEDCFHECSEELSESRVRKSWTRKLKFIKEATLGLKLKASKAYFKSFFNKSWRSNEKCAASKAECSHAYQMAAKKNPVERIKTGSYVVSHAMKSKEEEMMMEAETLDHRRSFSCANNWQSSNKSSISSSCTCSKSSSFSSANSKEFHGQPTLKRTSSVNSDIESSIQGAIAYCKKSQQDSARKSTSDVGFCLLSVSKIAPDHSEHEKLGLWRELM